MKEKKEIVLFKKVLRETDGGLGIRRSTRIQIERCIEELEKDNEFMTKIMKKASGEINDSSDLVCFIYLLGRDYLPLGTIEEIMNNNLKKKEALQFFTNGWLAQYAKNVAERLSKEE